MKNLLLVSLTFVVTISASAQQYWSPYPQTGTTTGIEYGLDVRSGTRFTISGVGSMGKVNTNDVQLYANGKLRFAAGGDQGNHITILTNGNVGIGTTVDPTAKLEVNGDLRSTRYILTGSGTLEGSSYDLKVNANNKIIFAGGGSTANQMVLTADGRLGINATNINNRLTVGGGIGAQEVTVTVNAGSDFVFEKSYKLPTIEEVEMFISKHHHLPDVAPASEMERDGIELGKMDMKLLQKIEELTLYMIDFRKEMDQLKEENGLLKAEISDLKKR